MCQPAAGLWPIIMNEADGPRRSTRTVANRVENYTQVSPAHQKGGLLVSLTKKWRQHYIDMGHARLSRCCQRLEKASPTEIRELVDARADFSFTAMAISAASAYGASKEPSLLEYVQVVLARNLSPNDEHFGNTAVVLAAYHGYHDLLRALLEAGCWLDGTGEYGHAIMAAVRNGQHESLRLLLLQPTASALLTKPCRAADSVLCLAFERRDCASVRMLRDAGLMLRDNELVRLAVHRAEVLRLEPIIRQLHPDIRDVTCWTNEIHWSFPATDRAMLSLLWHSFRRPGAPDLLPDVLWLHIFSFVRRGWWASRQLFPHGRPHTNLLPINILG